MKDMQPTLELRRADYVEAGIKLVDDQGRRADEHSIRSSFATRLVRSGVDLSKVQRLLRHSSPLITTKSYMKLQTTDLRAAIRTPAAAGVVWSAS